MALDELVSYGTTGLLEAAERFDPGRGAAFTTFAYYRIRGAIYDGLREMSRIPRRAYRRLMASQRAGEYLEQLGRQHLARERQRSASPAPELGDTVRELHDALRSAATAAAVVMAAAPRSSHVSPDDWLEQKQLVSRLQRAITALPDKERHFIEQCYFHDRSVTEAGRQIGLSKSWSSRLHARAIDQLRDVLRETE